MDANQPNGVRRTEDVALDLMKFIATAAHVGSKAPGSTGFGASSSSKPDDQVTELLQLYSRCREAVETTAGAATPAAKPAK